VHPENAAKLWQRLLDAGGVPCGLGARDSLRVEAGLPLYGHELAGQYNISPFEAGYGWAVKLDKEFFIGKPAMEKIAKSFDMQVARIELPGEKGVRPVRQSDGIIRDGVCIGWVLSCAKANRTGVRREERGCGGGFGWRVLSGAKRKPEEQRQKGNRHAR
jgi:glycine hydroxymethyltransferase